MSDSGSGFPPKAQHPEDIELLIPSFACVTTSRTAWYVSSPLTTGERSIEWKRLTMGDVDGPSSSFRRDVIDLNRRDTAKFVEHLRGSVPRILIDPTALADLPNWTQSDYHVLWGRVIERYAETIVFRNGWQHSHGCAYEFLTACLAGCTLLREDLSPLGIAEAQSLLEAAAVTAHQQGASGFLDAVLKALKKGGVA